MKQMCLFSRLIKLKLKRIIALIDMTQIDLGLGMDTNILIT